MKSIQLKVPDIRCMNCVNAINKALSGMAGVSSCGTDLASKTVKVDYDESKTTLEKIVTKIDDLGFEVES